MLLNIAIIPPVTVACVVASIGRDLAGSGDAAFVVDGVHRHAHMTIFMARYPTDAVPEVRHRVSGLRLPHALRLEHDGYYLTPGGYYEISYRLTSELRQFQESVIEAVAGLRYSPGRPRREPYFGPYTEQQRENVEKCGYDLAWELFRPHITISKLNGGATTSQLPRPSDDLSFDAKRVGLFEADQDGAVADLLEHREL